MIGSTLKPTSKPSVPQGPQKISETSGSPLSPVVSPQGDTVIFAAGTSQPLVRELYSVGLDGTEQKQLTDRRVNLSWHPAITPDGEKLAYVVEKEGRSDLHVMNMDGTGNHNITNTNKGYWSPAWSPDGKELVVTSRDTERGNLEIVKMAADGSEKTQVTRLGLNTDTPVFSATGSHIVFGLAPGFGAPVLASIRANGEGFKTYATELILAGKPVVSPDDEVIFSATKGDGRFGIYQVDLESEEPAKLLIDQDFALSPTLSPDGTKLAWRGNGPNGRGQIFEANSDGTEITQITKGDGFSSSPSYTPDGNSLVFTTSDKERNEEVYLQQLR